MTVGELVNILLGWEDNVEVSFGTETGEPSQFADGEPVLVVKENGAGIVLPDGMYIGHLSDERARLLGWTR